MAKKKKRILIPTFFEILQKQRVQVITPKGGIHLSKKEYNRKKRKDFLTEWD
jgi:hypothetical protein